MRECCIKETKLCCAEAYKIKYYLLFIYLSKKKNLRFEPPPSPLHPHGFTPSTQIRFVIFHPLFIGLLHGQYSYARPFMTLGHHQCHGRVRSFNGKLCFPALNGVTFDLMFLFQHAAVVPTGNTFADTSFKRNWRMGRLRRTGAKLN